MSRSKSREPGELDQTPESGKTSRAHVHKAESTGVKDRKRKKHHRKDDSHKHKRKKSSRTRSPSDKRKKMLSEDDDWNDIKVTEELHHKALRDEPQSDIPKQEILNREISKCKETTGEDAIISDPYHFARSKFDEEDEEEIEETQIIDDGSSETSHLDEVEDSSQNIIAEANEEVAENVESITDNENADEEKTPYLSDSSPHEELPPYYPAIQGCRSVNDFHFPKISEIGKGTYGVVNIAIDLKQRTVVALKKLKLNKEEKNGFPVTSLREIKILMTANHENIVAIKEVVTGKHLEDVYIVMEYIEHDMMKRMEKMSHHFSIGQVKSLMKQLLTGVDYLHDNWIIHRDLKTSNLLLSNSGILKIADFGLARECGSSPKPYTTNVITLWYRCPELLLKANVYNSAVDMWSVGCIFGEFLSKKPTFMGKTEIEQIKCISKTLGIPTETIWKGVSELEGMKDDAVKNALSKTNTYNLLKKMFEKYLRSDKGFDLMNGLLTYDPSLRMTAKKALKHQFFTEYPHAIHPSMFPKWPAKINLTKLLNN